MAGKRDIARLAAFKYLPVAFSVSAFLAGCASFAYLAYGGAASGLGTAFLTAGSLLLAASGLSGMLSQLLLRETSTRLGFYRSQALHYRAEYEKCVKLYHQSKRRIESLSLTREIHSTSNICSKSERLRKILGVVRDVADASNVSLFGLDRDRKEPRLLAYLRKSVGKEFFLRLAEPFHGKVQLDIRNVTEVRRGEKLELRGEIFSEDILVGSTQCVVVTSGRNGSGADDPIGMLVREISSSCVDESNLREAMEGRRPVKTRDERSGVFELVYPLIAEGGLVGAMKVSLPAELADADRLGEIGDTLEESARHIAIAIRKEEDAERARRDGLTGLYRRRWLDEHLLETWRSARADNSSLALIMMDIDHFSRINNRYGHQTGDIVLRGVARLVRAGIRSSDFACRYGGEEISILLPDTDIEHARATAERLLQAIETTVFIGADRRKVKVTSSFGVADYRSGMSSPEELTRHADEALYNSKRRGRNRVTAWPFRRKRARRVPKRKIAS